VLDGTRIGYRFSLVFGSTSSMPAGFNTFSLPAGFTVAAASVLHGFVFDAGGVGYHATGRVDAASSVFYVYCVQGGVTLRSGSPITWATSDELRLQGEIFGSF
jgi:hypothetical protein